MNNQDLRKAGLKVTLPRVRILEILAKASSNHLSAEDVYRALIDSGEEVGLATVYRVLTQFEAAGIVKKHNFESGHSVFELKQDEHHDHLVCTQCGHIEEFFNETIEALQIEVAEQFGFQITEHSLNIYGLCPKCRESNT